MTLDGGYRCCFLLDGAFNFQLHPPLRKPGTWTARKETAFAASNVAMATFDILRLAFLLLGFLIELVVSGLVYCWMK